MAEIRTDKSNVVLLNDPQPSNIGFGVGPKIVSLTVKNDGVSHLCALDPNEAVRIGVTLIQLAHQAQAIGMQVPPGILVPPGHPGH